MTATLRALSVVAGQQQTPAGPTSQAVAGDRPLRCPSTRGHGLCGLRTRVPHRGQRLVVNTYPEPETEKERSPIDFPQEWLTPTPSRRPDIFPEFEKQDTPLPKPMPGDPEQPEDEEEEDKKKKEEEGDEEDPDKEQPEEPAEE